MNKKLLAIAAAALMAGPMAANAVIITTTLNNVTIGSDVYNVTFSQDDDGYTTFNDLYGTGSPLLTFTTQADALAATTAVRAAADALNFDYTPAVSSPNTFALVFAYTGTTYSYFTGWSDSPIFNGVFGPFSQNRGTTELIGTFASFQRVTAVPEPGTLALFGLGLAGLGLVRRRRAA